MKTTLMPALALMLLSACAREPAAPDAATATPPMAAAPAPAAAPATAASASGTVESVDTAAGKIVIAHGPVAAVNWPAMTMGFAATPEQMASVKPGDRVDFEFASQGAANTLTRITPAR